MVTYDHRNHRTYQGRRKNRIGNENPDPHPCADRSWALRVGAIETRAKPLKGTRSLISPISNRPHAVSIDVKPNNPFHSEHATRVQ